MINLFLSFSDAAKYAEVAKSLVGEGGFSTNFTFLTGPPITLPVTSLSIALLFKILGVGDFPVIVMSIIYFVLTLAFVFLFARKIYKNNLVGWLSTLGVGFNADMIHYATHGASESPFIFEIVSALYFVSLKKQWGNAIAIFLVVLMYFTRPQAFIYIAGILLYWLILNFKIKKAIIYFLGLSVIGILIDRFILASLPGKYFIYSILGKGSNILSQVAVAQSASEQLRGGISPHSFSLFDSFKKVFYNLYNFYKLLPQIINPYLFALFVIGLFTKGTRELKIVVCFMVFVTFFVTAASIPFFRYIHPVIPLVYIVAIGTLVWLVEKITTSKKYVAIISSFLIIVFAIGQTLGIVILDSRYKRNTHNLDKPPVYVKLSWVLKENTGKDQKIVTNLDTWGSWYGERKTIWFPLEPKQLIDSSGEIPFDAIYLTSYLMDDPNYYMGNGWRSIFENPNDNTKWICDGCSEIAKKFTLKGIFIINSEENYERSDASAVLLIKR